MTMTTTPPSGEPEAQDSDGRLRRRWQRRGSRLAVGVVAGAVALTAAAVALAQGIGQFRDVPANHYARDAVEWAVQNDITYGCRDGTYFCPERNSEQGRIGHVPAPLPQQRDQTARESDPERWNARSGQGSNPNHRVRERHDTHDGAARGRSPPGAPNTRSARSASRQAYTQPCSRWRPPRQQQITIRVTTATKAAPPATSPKR